MITPLYYTRILTPFNRRKVLKNVADCFSLSIFIAIACIFLSYRITTAFVPSNAHFSQVKETTHEDRFQRLKGIVAETGHQVDHKIIESFLKAEEKTGIDAVLLYALAVTESNVNHSRKSIKGYHGIMQIPIYTTASSNILIGAKIFKDKLEQTRGDIKKAIALYKGYGVNRKGLEKAEAVLQLYSVLSYI